MLGALSLRIFHGINYALIRVSQLASRVTSDDELRLIEERLEAMDCSNAELKTRVAELERCTSHRRAAPEMEEMDVIPTIAERMRPRSSPEDPACAGESKSSLVRARKRREPLLEAPTLDPMAVPPKPRRIPADLSEFLRDKSLPPKAPLIAAALKGDTEIL